jgi:hypothetical protein
MFADLRTRHAGRHTGAHNGADGGTRDRHRADAEFIQRLDDVDMREAACATAAEGDGNRR